MKKKLRHQKCEGEKEEVRKQLLSAKQHTVAQCSGMGLPLSFCLKCGAWTTRRLYKLAETCAAKRSRAGEQALAYIKKGLHPWLAQGMRAEHRKPVGQGFWEPAEDGRVARAKRRRKNVQEAGEGEGGEGKESKEGEAATRKDPLVPETPQGSYSYGGSSGSGQRIREPTIEAQPEAERLPIPAKRRRLRGKQPPPREEDQGKLREAVLQTETPPRPAKRQRIRGKQPQKGEAAKSRCRTETHAVNADCKRRRREGCEER